jgi:hypothetical protein
MKHVMASAKTQQTMGGICHLRWLLFDLDAASERMKVAMC